MQWLSSYIQLIAFSFYSNQFTGTIPDGVYELEGLEVLDVTGNMLTGTVSTQIGKLEKLIFLNIADNMMTGTIPTEIGSLSNLCMYTRTKSKLIFSTRHCVYSI
jgi:hypothetical protein